MRRYFLYKNRIYIKRGEEGGKERDVKSLYIERSLRGPFIAAHASRGEFR
jgi:hypothetical protein